MGVLRDLTAGVVADERNLSRAVRLVEAGWRRMSLEPLGGMALGTPVTLPRAAVFGGQRDLILRALLDSCTNLWPLLQELEREGVLTIDTVSPNAFGHKVKNPGTLIVWHAPAG